MLQGNKGKRFLGREKKKKARKRHTTIPTKTQKITSCRQNYIHSGANQETSTIDQLIK